MAIVFSAFLGLSPLLSPHNILLLFLVMVLRINLTMFLLGLGLFKLLAYLLDPVSHQIGLQLLQAEGLSSLWHILYNDSFWRFMAFNNTLVMGGFALSLVLSLPIFFISRWLVVRYRDHLLQWVSKTRLLVWLKGSRLYSVYSSLK